jgi:Rieske Fe-S protein
MDRKAFIKLSSMACLCSTSMGVLIQSCATNYYANFTETNEKIIINKSEFVKKKGENQTSYNHIIIKSEKLQFPICIFQLENNEYSALLMECTHNSCELQNQGQYLMCPCHGSEFNNKGIVQNPPAEQNLKSFKTQILAEQIIIFLN